MWCLLIVLVMLSVNGYEDSNPNAKILATVTATLSFKILILKLFIFFLDEF